MSNSTFDSERLYCALQTSAYSINAVCEKFNIDRRALMDWIRDLRKPRAKNIAKINTVIEEITKTKKIEFHSAYGYATPEQFAELDRLGLSKKREALKRQIERQQKHYGKTIFASNEL